MEAKHNTFKKQNLWHEMPIRPQPHPYRMNFTCILLSHKKPALVREAIASVQAQTYSSWNCVLWDSGSLYDAGHFADLADDPRFLVVRSDETPEMKKALAIAPRSFNECFRRDLVSGDLVLYLADDDVLLPECMQAFADFFASRPDAKAAYGHQRWGFVDEQGQQFILGERIATNRFRGSWDCQVDGGQLAHRRELWNLVQWSEDRHYERHSDGMFLESIAEKTTIHPVDAYVSINRKCKDSTFSPLRIA